MDFIGRKEVNIKVKNRGWRGDSAVKNTCSSFRRPEIRSEYQSANSWPAVTPVPGIPGMLSSNVHGNQSCMYCNIHAGKALTYKMKVISLIKNLSEKLTHCSQGGSSSLPCFSKPNEYSFSDFLSRCLWSLAFSRLPYDQLILWKFSWHHFNSLLWYVLIWNILLYLIVSILYIITSSLYLYYKNSILVEIICIWYVFSVVCVCESEVALSSQALPSLLTPYRNPLSSAVSPLA